MAVVQHAAAKQAFSSGTSGTVTVALGTAAVAGNCLVACVTASNAASTTPSVTAVKTGSLTENWAAAKTVNDTTQSGYVTIWTDQNTGGGGTAVAVTVAFGQTNSASAQTSVTVDVYEVSGVPASGAVDATAASTLGNSGTSWSSGATGTTAQASEIAFGVTLIVPTGGGGGTVTGPSSPWVNSTVQSQAYTGAFGSYTLYGMSGYEVLSSTGTVTYSGTVNTASYWDTCAVTLKYSVTTPGAAALSGSGTVTVGSLVTQPASAALSGSGTVTAAAQTSVLPSAALFGEGFLTPAATVFVPGQGSANLAGSGSLSVSRSVTYAPAVPLSGTGTLGAQETGIIQEAVPLSGSGTLGVAGAATLKYTAGLFGAGFLSIPQVAGGLVSGIGGAASPMALPGSSQVAVAPPGSSNWQWLGTLGQVTALTYSYTCPGGADKMTCTVMVPASYQSQLFYPGWQVKIVRGGHDIWHGKLDQPSYQPRQGWTLTAVGNGNRGTDFNAYYAIGWPGSEPDEVLNRAIIRGLPWLNPGYNSAPFASQFWLGQPVDAGSQKVSDFLNMICSRGGLTWYVNSQPGGLYGGDDLQIFPLPTTPTRLLVSTTPVPRTLGGYTNYILIKYQSSADNTSTSTPAAYSYVAATNPASITAHGQLEAYLDLSDAGTLSSGQAQAVGQSILSIYVAASFAGPFQVSYGQLLNMGGQAVDIGTDQAGGMAKLVLADSSYGGSVDMSEPVSFIIGSYEYNDFQQVATIRPFATLDESLSGLMSAANQSLKPVTVASG